MKTIEQLEQEKADILAKALRLIELVKLAYEGTAISRTDWDKAVGEIEALMPKPERLRRWIEVNSCDGFEGIWQQEPQPDNLKRGHRAVPMIEVVPFDGEVPTWEEWTEDQLLQIRDLHPYGNACFKVIVEAANKRMAALQSFIDQLLAERGEG